MIDLDNFKQLNDDFRHQIGDQTLKAVANILKKSSRDVDFACRYGGEEFAVILTNADKELAYTVAERIRKNIESYTVKDLPTSRNITVSIGISTYPIDTSTKPDLIALADRAMYVAKLSGKNRTCVHTPKA